MAIDDTTDDLTIGTGSTIGSNVKMVIENGGEVGIGLVDPGAQLHVDGGNLYLTKLNSSTYFLIGQNSGMQAGTWGGLSWNYTNQYLEIYTSDAGSGNQIVLKESGNVGVNTTAPLHNLDVDGRIKERHYHWIEDFDDEVASVEFESGLVADFWVTAGTNYASADVIYIQYSSQALQATTHGADNDSVTLTGSPMIRTSYSPVVEVRFKLTDISNAFIGLGLVEGSFADKASPDDDIILIGLDSDNGHGFGADHLFLMTNNDAGGVDYDDTGVALVADTWTTVMFDCTSVTQPRVWIDGTEIAAGSISGTIQNAIYMSPYIMVQSLSEAADVLKVDYIEIWQDRL